MEKTEDLQSLIARLDEIKKNNPDPGNIPIRGAVNAGWSQPASSPGPAEIKSSTAPPVFTKPKSSDAGEQSAFVQHSRQTAKIISVEEAFARWDEFVATVKNNRINLGSVLSQSRLVDVAGGCMKLECENEFQLSTLKRSSEFLGEISKQVFGAPTPVEVVMNRNLKPANGDPESPREEHPVIAAMRQELGAEPVE
jgi:hypothetical protein